MLHLVAPAPQAQALLAQPNPVPLVTGRKHQSSPLPLVERAPHPLLFNLLIWWGGLWSSPLKGDGGLSMAALTVEHLKVLLVEHLKVQFTYWVGGLMVEPACASLTVEPAYAFNLLLFFLTYLRGK